MWHPSPPPSPQPRTQGNTASARCPSHFTIKLLTNQTNISSPTAETKRRKCFVSLFSVFGVLLEMTDFHQADVRLDVRVLNQSPSWGLSLGGGKLGRWLEKSSVDHKQLANQICPCPSSQVTVQGFKKTKQNQTKNTNLCSSNRRSELLSSSDKTEVAALAQCPGGEPNSKNKAECHWTLKENQCFVLFFFQK